MACFVAILLHRYRSVSETCCCDVNVGGVAAGLFIFAYCFYYYFARSDMSGFMQVSFHVVNGTHVRIVASVFLYLRSCFAATDELLLLLHGHDLLCLPPDAGSSRLPCQSHLCKAHLQVWLICHGLLHDIMLHVLVCQSVRL